MVHQGLDAAQCLGLDHELENIIAEAITISRGEAQLQVQVQQ